MILAPRLDAVADRAAVACPAVAVGSVPPGCHVLVVSHRQERDQAEELLVLELVQPRSGGGRTASPADSVVP